MSLIEQIKRAAINHGMYEGPIDDNWEPADRLMFHSLCTRFHGNYTDHPSRDNQNPDFLEWLDNYKDLEYSEEPSKHKAINPGGADLRQFVPDKQPVNTENATKQEIKERDARVNENHIKLNSPKKATVPDPKKVVEEEAKNDVQDQSSLRSGDENRSETDNKSDNGSQESSDGQANSNDVDPAKQSNESNDEVKKAVDTEEKGAATPPAKPFSSNKPAPFVKNNPSTIKTR